MQKLDEIWADDLLNRRNDAELLAAYVESLYSSKDIRKDLRIFTIAVEAPYGFGKTFFLRRLKQHLELNHPVAYIDAWADDIADEPLTAIVATLKSALHPLFVSSQATTAIWKKLAGSAGTLTAIAAKGVAKKVMGALITPAATEALADAIGTIGADVKLNKKNIESVADEAISGGLDSLISKSQALMDERILEFEVGKAAIRDVRARLSEVVDGLTEAKLTPPIIIIVDELDRCRPTYAIKLLEELKHIFEVPGVVFLIGMNGDQLSKSMTATYGHTFDGYAYLRRFISRTFRISEAELLPLIQIILRDSGIDANRIDLYQGIHDAYLGPVSIDRAIASYVSMYKIAPRDVFHFIDILRTSLALTAPKKLVGEYFFPLIACMINGGAPGVLVPPATKEPEITFVAYDSMGKRKDITGWRLASQIDGYTRMTLKDLRSRMNDDRDDTTAVRIYEARTSDANEKENLSSPACYGRLLSSVGRFT